jgi:hypothetical protein
MYYQSPKISLGVILGGILSLINIEILTKIVENLFQQDVPSKSIIVVQYVIKIVLLFGILYAVITYKPVDIIAFVVGFSAFFIALLIENIFPSRHSV